MKPSRLRPSYGSVTLSPRDIRRLRQEWSVIETPLRPMRLAFAIAASLGLASRRPSSTRAAA